VAGIPLFQYSIEPRWSPADAYRAGERCRRAGCFLRWTWSTTRPTARNYEREPKTALMMGYPRVARSGTAQARTGTNNGFESGAYQPPQTPTPSGNGGRPPLVGGWHCRPCGQSVPCALGLQSCTSPPPQIIRHSATSRLLD
jgi:hypothetical protein